MLCLRAVLVCAMIANTPVIGASMETKRLPRILALYSTGPDSSSATPFEDIMRSALEQKLGSRVQVENRFLELDRFRHMEHAQALARTLRDDYSLNALDLIVPIGFPALQFTTTHLAGSFPNTAVLFVAVAARRIQDFQLPSNTTGVVHIDDWKGALTSILDIHPDCEQIVVVSGSAPSDHEQLEIQKSLFQVIRKSSPVSLPGGSFFGGNDRNREPSADQERRDSKRVYMGCKPANAY